MRKLPLLALLCILLAAPIAAHAQLGDVLTFGSPVTGSIASDALERRYIFEAAAGDVLIARMSATTEGLDTYLTLLDPSGAVIFSDDDSGGNRNSLLGPARIPAAGAYVLVASSCCPGSLEPSTGDYSLVIDRLTPQALTLGTNTTFELPAAESIVAYTLDVTGPALLRFDVSGLQGSGNIILTAFDAQNAQRAYDARSTDPNSVFYPTPPAYAPTSGTFLISIRRDLMTTMDSSGAALPGVTGGTLVAQSIPLTPYSLGSAASGTLDDANPVAAYSFAGDASALLSLVGSAAADSGDFELYLYAPNGSINYSASTAFTEGDAFTIDPLQLLGAGDYAILVQRTNATGAAVAGTSSAFTFTLAGSTISSLVPGQAVAGSVDAGTPERTYRLDGTAGQRLRFTIAPTSDTYAPSMYIQGPELVGSVAGANVGAPIFSANMSSATSASFIYEVTLPVNGVYLVRVSNGLFSPEGLIAGDFSLLMESVGG